MERGCTQGDIDLPIIFNVIIDTVVRCWKQLNEQSKSFFYADDGLLENTNPEDLQKDLDLIIKLFERLGLKTNKTKTKSMIIIGTPSPIALQKRGDTKYVECRKQDTQCNICSQSMKKASLQRHIEQIHNIKPEKYLYRKTCTPASFTINIKDRYTMCPVPGCAGGSSNKYRMYRHFCFKHPEAIVVVPEDGILPQCKLCGMFTKNIKKHQKIETCQKGRRRRKNEQLQDTQHQAQQINFL